MKLHMPQRKSKLGKVDSNLKVILEEVERSDADLVIFPELFLTGYVIKDDTRSHALELDSEPVKAIVDAAKDHGRTVIFGMPEKSSRIRGQVHNTSVVAFPDGHVEAYRKIHMVNFGPFEEWQFFSPGKDLTMINVGGFRIGLIICYDLFFPELCRAYALAGADAVIGISASPSVTGPFFEKVMTARAIENTIYYIFSNMLGTEGDLVFWGGCQVVGPRGEVRVRGKDLEEDDVITELDAEELRVARTYRPTIRDARLDVCEALVDSLKIALVDQKE